MIKRTTHIDATIYDTRSEGYNSYWYFTTNARQLQNAHQVTAYMLPETSGAIVGDAVADDGEVAGP